jgi:hypothetical protein
VVDRLRYIIVGSTLGAAEGTDRKGHGTSMMSQITGWKVGLSKLVSPVVVQIDVYAAETQFLVALSAIIEDVDRNKIKQAVLW